MTTNVWLWQVTATYAILEVMTVWFSMRGTLMLQNDVYLDTVNKYNNNIYMITWC